MINLPINKIYNSYLIETMNRDSAIASIKDFIERFGFDKKVVDSGAHPDYQEVEVMSTKQRNTINESVMDKVNIKPTIADRKVFIIYSDVLLEPSTQNMLLKTLEEPPEYVSIFIITTNKENFLDTIKSRVFLIRDTELDKASTIELSDDEKKNTSLILADLKFRDEYDITNFSKENSKNASNIIYYILSIAKDSLYYKRTFDKKKLINESEFPSIESICDTYDYQALGTLISETEDVIMTLNTNVDKELSINHILFKTRNALIKD